MQWILSEEDLKKLIFSTFDVKEIIFDDKRKQLRVEFTMKESPGAVIPGFQ